METTQVLLVDAFADEMLGGRPTGVTTGDCSRAQHRAIAGELGTGATATMTDEGLEVIERDGAHAPVAGAVAGCLGFADEDRLAAGTHSLTVVAGDGHERSYDVEFTEDRSVTVSLHEQSVTTPDIGLDRLGPALGIDSAAMQDVGADMPLGHVDAFGGTLLVPVNFLERLSGASPDAGTLADVLAETGAARVCAFTFDTLGRETDLHARIFDPTAAGDELPASGVAAGACGRYLARQNAFDGEREAVRVECGHFLDRPATIETTVERAPEVTGRGLVSLDGTVPVPEDDSDEILEA